MGLSSQLTSVNNYNFLRLRKRIPESFKYYGASDFQNIIWSMNLGASPRHMLN